MTRRQRDVLLLILLLALAIAITTQSARLNPYTPAARDHIATMDAEYIDRLTQRPGDTTVTRPAITTAAARPTQAP